MCQFLTLRAALYVTAENNNILVLQHLRGRYAMGRQGCTRLLRVTTSAVRLTNNKVEIRGGRAALKIVNRRWADKLLGQFFS